MKYKSNKSSPNRTKEMFENIVNKLQIIVDNGEYEKFLKFQKNFRSYSFINLILIFSQFPDATQLAGKSKWKKLNRTPTSDAKKIWIIAPIPRKYDKKVKKIKDGEEIEETETILYNAYRWVYVYDISQTEGKDIPLQSKVLNSNNMSYLYEKLKAFSNVHVLEKELLVGTEGYYNSSEKYIVIKNTLSLNDKASVLLHELSHALYDDFDYKTDRNLSEVFVESISFIVADHFGLDTSCCSFNYIIKWANGDPKVVIDLGSKIQKYANEFIDKLEKFEMQELKLVA